jgi:hypothetical protein
MNTFAQIALAISLMFGALALPEVIRSAGESGRDGWRYSLRTVMAMMTLAGIVLWLIGYLVRK